MEYLFFISEIQYDSTSSLPCPAAWRGVFAQQNIGESRGAWRRGEVLKRPSVEIIEVTLLFPCRVPQHGRGGVLNVSDSETEIPHKATGHGKGGV